jgi:hypothetical protein
MTTNIESYNLDQFSRKAFELYSKEDHGDFIRFVVNGKVGDNQVVIDPIQHTLPVDQVISQLRDYDSVIGLSANVEVKRSIYIYPVANPRDTLTESLHLQYEIPNGHNVSIGAVARISLNFDFDFLPGTNQRTYTQDPKHDVRKVGRPEHDPRHLPQALERRPSQSSTHEGGADHLL